MNKCGCTVDVVATTINDGFISISSNGRGFGNVSGIHKSDVSIRGMKIGLGLVWYAGNNEIGGMVKREDEFLEIVKMSSEDFFNSEIADKGHIALVAIANVGDYNIYVSAVSYLGNNHYLFASKIFNVAAIWSNADIILPKEVNIPHGGNVVEVDVTKDKYSKQAEFGDVTITKMKIALGNVREELFKQVKKDLKYLEVPTPTDFVDIQPYGIKDNYFANVSSFYKNNSSLSGISDLSVNVNQELFFNNLLLLCWENECNSMEVHELKNNKNSLFVPCGGRVFVSSGNKTACLTDNCIINFDKMSVNENGFIINSSFGFNVNGVLFEHEKFVVPIIPKGTLAYQFDDIDSLINVNKIVKYSKKNKGK